MYPSKKNPYTMQETIYVCVCVCTCTYVFIYFLGNAAWHKWDLSSPTRD